MGEEKKEENGKADALSSNKLVIAAFICLMSYAVLFALNAARTQIGTFPDFFPIFTIPSILVSPMFLILPFFAFFAVFFLVDWVNRQFKTRLGLSPIFPIVFLFVSLAAYYIARYWYMANLVSLQGLEMSLELVDFWPKLSNSAFMLFIWGGIFGWIARYAVEKINL